MTLYGTATVYGTNGTVTHTGAAIAAIPESTEEEHSAEMEEFKDGNNELIGFHKTDERIRLTIVMVPKATTIDNARKSLKFPVAPSKVTLSGFADSAATDLGINADYIYAGGGSRTTQRGRAALRLPIYRPLSSPLTVDQLVAVIS